MRKCKITVLKRMYYKDLVDEYCRFGDFGPCPVMKEGDVFYTGGLWGGDMPEGFCTGAWDAIKTQATALAFGGKAYGYDDVHILCCNDGLRPVIYKLEAIDDGQERPIKVPDWPRKD